MEELQLRPCPFCGGEVSIGKVLYSNPEPEWGQDTFFYINCIKCGSNNKPIIGFDAPELAAEHWNTRPIEDALRSELERVKIERDRATEVVENIQGKVAMYAGKYEMEKKAREKAEAERDEMKESLPQ